MFVSNRTSGILMPISSLPGPYGIGTLGKPAFAFVDFLKKAKQHMWQILPLAQTGFGDSPYQSCSAFAGNPYFIDLDMLCADGLLTRAEYAKEDFGSGDGVDYAALYKARYRVLRLAFERFSKWFPDAYYRFCFEQGWWLEDYALYMTAKELNGNTCWRQWPEAQRNHEQSAIEALYAQHEKEVHFWKFCQYEFSLQWAALKTHANNSGVQIMGDMPIYVADDSADVWAGRAMFQLEADGTPCAVAGCPPDAFSATGQLWGNPLYNWTWHASSGYAWWISRIRYAIAQYDFVRIDHFRAFDTYYCVPYGDKDACGGHWENGPGMALFGAVKAALGDIPIIAEDLGNLFESVHRLLADSGFAGMKVLQFAFDPGCDSEYLPHNHVAKSVVYTGTHDNTTTADWLKTQPLPQRKKAIAYLGLNKDEGYVAGFLRAALSSVSLLCIIPMADWLGLGSEGRINTPSTLGGGNWSWRADKSALSAQLAKRIALQTALFGRT